LRISKTGALRILIIILTRISSRQATTKKRKSDMAESEENTPRKVTDIDAVKENVRMAVEEFAERWISMPGFGLDVEVMSVSQLRDAMGLRASIDWGDPWPAAEQELIAHGFRWHWLGGQRVMYLRERDDFVPDTGWGEAEEVEV
jgi:hypothetical protein